MRSGIVVIGFMGSGKTTVARALAEQLSIPFVDLDEFILAHEARSAREIIELDGEAAFRVIETKALQQVLALEQPQVVAPGGGAWTIARNRELIAEAGALAIWLDAPFEVCWQRIKRDGDSRPLAPSREAAQDLYFTRLPLYELAEGKIEISEADSAQDIATRITEKYSLMNST